MPNYIIKFTFTRHLTGITNKLIRECVAFLTNQITNLMFKGILHERIKMVDQHVSHMKHL